MLHKVTLTRTVVFETEVEVQASNQIEAAKLAEQLAPGKQSDYDMVHVSPVRAVSALPVRQTDGPEDVDLAAAPVCSD